MFTLKDIAAKLGKPESTVRYWRDQYAEYIPCTGTGRRRVYPEQAAEVLRLVCDMMERNVNANEVKEALSRMFPMTLDVDPETQRKTTTTQRKREGGLLPATRPGVDLPMVQGMISEALSRTLEIIADQKTRLDILEQRNMDLEKKVAAMTRRTPTNRDQADDIAEIRALIHEALLWCERLDAVLNRINRAISRCRLT